MKNVQKIDLGLTGYDELFANDEERKVNKLPRIFDIPISEIDDFPDHPFKVKIDEDMDQLVQSIKERGIITPVTLRPKEDGRYEIVSGHRRKKACELAGLDTVKAEVREMSRDEAIIGNGTMNIMFINDKKPVPGNMFTEKFGTHQCLLAARENVMRVHHTTVDDAIINRVFRFGTADINEKYLKTITDTATEYVEGIFQRLREHEYNPELMRLYVLGGGSCLIRNFGTFDKERVTINDDICATAKGYEYLAELNMRRGSS